MGSDNYNIIILFLSSSFEAAGDAALEGGEGHAVLPNGYAKNLSFTHFLTYIKVFTM